MKVFMIGGTGLLGCEAAIQLIKRGHSVKSVALPPLPQGAPIPEEMELIMANINEKTDDEVLEMLEGCETYHYLGDELDNLYTEYWNKVKSE